MAGMTAAYDLMPADPAPLDVPSLFTRAPVAARTFEAAQRRVRDSMQGLQWAGVCAAGTRHYKTPGKVHASGRSPAAYTAWVHALEASPWVIPAPDWHGRIALAYAGTFDSAFEPGVSLGAAELAEDHHATVVHLETPQRVRDWLQRIGPCVIEGGWSAMMGEVRRDTETIGPRGEAAYPHAVALVGVRPTAVRLVNDKGPAWGALGRAWMPNEVLCALLADGGEAFGVIPSPLVAKKGGR